MSNSLIEALDTSYVAIWSWGKGKYAPAQKAVRDTAATVVSKFIGQKISSDTLFPKSK